MARRGFLGFDSGSDGELIAGFSLGCLAFFVTCGLGLGFVVWMLRLAMGWGG